MAIKDKISRNKVLFTFIIIFIIGLSYLYWMYYRPYTQNAFVVANIRPVSPFVSGYVTNVYVKNNQTVKKGDKLFDIFKENYAFAVDHLTAQLDAAIAHKDTVAAQIDIAKYNVIKAQDTYANAKYLFQEYEWMYKRNAISQESAEKYMESMLEAQQALEAASNQVKALQATYLEAEANIKATTSQLGIAKLDLQWTTVYAQDDGYVTNMYLTPGTYLNAGNVVFAFIDTTEWWVQANFEETELSQIREGQKASIKLWQYPNKVFDGVVTATGWGVNRNQTDEKGMPNVQQENE